MQTLKTQFNNHDFIDYTTAPVGLFFKGRLATGQAVFSTIICPKCRRVGVATSQDNGAQIIVHSGRAVDDVLLGVDYCKLELNAPGTKSKKTV